LQLWKTVCHSGNLFHHFFNYFCHENDRKMISGVKIEVSKRYRESIEEWFETVL
jgi:hypothetical protein